MGCRWLLSQGGDRNLSPNQGKWDGKSPIQIIDLMDGGGGEEEEEKEGMRRVFDEFGDDGNGYGEVQYYKQKQQHEYDDDDEKDEDVNDVGSMESPSCHSLHSLLCPPPSSISLLSSQHSPKHHHHHHITLPHLLLLLPLHPHHPHHDFSFSPLLQCQMEMNDDDVVVWW